MILIIKGTEYGIFRVFKKQLIFPKPEHTEKIVIICKNNDQYLILNEYNIAGYYYSKDTLISEVTKVNKISTEYAGYHKFLIN